MTEFYIGQTFENEYPPDAAIWCNENNAMIEALEGGGFKIIEVQIHILTKEEISVLREQLYIKNVDKITCHINRLKDEEQTAEILAEIETLKAERAIIVAKIKEENPYPEE